MNGIFTLTGGKISILFGIYYWLIVNFYFMLTYVATGILEVNSSCYCFNLICSCPQVPA